jgi:ribosome-binding factor A
MKSYSRARVAGETVREHIARILLEEMADPRLDLLTVTGVEMSPDLRHADVFITTHGKERYEEVLAVLNAASGRIRSLLGAQMTLRYVPELHFRIDMSVDDAERIGDAIRAEREAGRGDGGEAPPASGDGDD